LFRIDRLVTLLVVAVGTVLDIRRQRQPAMGIDQAEYIVRKMQRVELAGALPDDHVEGIGEPDMYARRRRLGGAHLGMDGAVVQHPFDQHLDLAAAFLDAEKARLEHPGIVEHQQVAGREQVDDVGKGAVGQAAVSGR
jgi:hypothetical protein